MYAMNSVCKGDAKMWLQFYSIFHPNLKSDSSITIEKSFSHEQYSTSNTKKTVNKIGIQTT